MNSLELIGWKKGIQTVSLIEATSYYSTHSLVEAKRLVEQLLGGAKVSLCFESDALKEEFRRKAENLGAITKL